MYVYIYKIQPHTYIYKKNQPGSIAKKKFGKEELEVDKMTTLGSLEQCIIISKSNCTTIKKSNKSESE